MIIYKIVNKIDGKMYVGQTTQRLSERWWQHCNRSPSQGHRSYIYNAIQKDGESSFLIEQIDSAKSLEELNIMESTYIKAFNTISPNGYNLHPGGHGKICHPETKEKIRNTLKGRPFLNRQNGAAKGRPVSEARRKQISESLKGRANSWRYKKVQCVETGEAWDSVNDAAAALDIKRTTLSVAIKANSKVRKTGNSYKFA